MPDDTREPMPEDPTAEDTAQAEPPAEDSPAAESSAADAASGEPSDTGKIAAIRETLEAEAEAAPEPEPAELAETAETAADAGAEPAQELETAADVDMGPETRSNAWVWVGLIIGILIVAGLAGYAWWYTTSRPVTVPDIVGKLPAQAVQTLNDVDLRLGEVSEESTDVAPPGTVIAQDPAALDTLKPGDAVSFVVAAAPLTTKVPEVTGKSADEAAEELAQARLVAFPVDIYDANVASGLVISQLPSATVELPPGSSVALAVSLGPAPVQARVPEIAGLSEGDAAALLSASDLRGARYQSFDASIVAGEVIAQAPLPGTMVALDAIVQYLVSQGPGTAAVTVPSVTGKSRADAEKALKGAGLKPQVRQVSHPNVAKGLVISQMPEANDRTAKGATVGILVSKGNLARVPAPDLAGMSPEDAEKEASSAGLRWVVVEIAISDYEAGKVFAQYPAAGTEWPLRFPIIGVVAKSP